MKTQHGAWRISLAYWISNATRSHVHAHGYALGYPHRSIYAHAHTLTNTLAFPQQQ